MKTILVVDDEMEIIRVVRGYLEQAGFQVLSARDATTALTIFRHERPDLVVLDLNLPAAPGAEPLDGLDVARAIRQMPDTAGQTPIIMLTARADETDRVIGLELGADDYVPKPFSPRELTARIRAVLRRSTTAPSQPQRIEAGAMVIDPSRHTVTVDGDLVELTPTEFTLLRAMASETGRVFSREQLVSLLGTEYLGLERTMDSHIKNLRAKIEQDPRHPEYVLTVFGVGYKFSDAL
jgi:two-component system alkaline phosphatase synthesis response regulator PhoP